ncbi:MAG: phosphosulfolactate synthase [Blastococcus sp.]
MNTVPGFLVVPNRARKPRRQGRTHVLDKGLPVADVARLREFCEEVVDIWKFDQVCGGRSTRFTLPMADDRGTPVGVDVRRVVGHGVTPKVTTGILHNSDGSGQIGAGVAEAPLGCFRTALLDLDSRLRERNTP